VKDNFMARGMINPDGTYTVGSLSESDGLPPGTYQVYISGAEKWLPGKNGGPSMRVLLIDFKYGSGDTSGLTVDVPIPGGKFDFQVEPNAKK
jgi:hypothetical protein